MIDTSLLAALGIALAFDGALHGGRLFELRWKPTRHTAAAVAAGLLPAFLSALCLLTPRDSQADQVLLFIGIFGFCGFFVPWAYVLFVERRSPAALGIRSEAWIRSPVISGVFALGPIYGTLEARDLETYRLGHLLGAAVQLNGGGLFEVLLFCGFVHLRLRDALGPLPAIIASAGIDSFGHPGTELPMHADPAAAMVMLFFVGLLCHALFATTYNVLAVWPLFFTAGVMHDFVVRLDLPAAVGTSMLWSTLGRALALAVPGGLWCASRRRLLRAARREGMGRPGS